MPGTVRYNLIKLIELLKLKNLYYNDNYYNNVKEKHSFTCVICNYSWKTSIRSILYNNTGCLRCHNREKLTINDIKKICLKYNFEFIDDVYNGKNSKHNIKCNICKYVDNVIMSNFINSTKHSCAKCSNRLKKGMSWVIDLCRLKNLIPKFDDYKTQKEKKNFECKKCKYIWNASIDEIKVHNCPKCRKFVGEELVRGIFEELTGEKFYKCRPEFMRNPSTNRKLELDGYNDKLKIAFEHQGVQHYEINKIMKYDIVRVNKQKEIDKIKVKLCKENNVKLIIIPQIGKYITYDKAVELIKEQLAYNHNNNNI